MPKGRERALGNAVLWVGVVAALPNSFNCGYVHEIGPISVLAGMEESSPGICLLEELLEGIGC